MPELEDQIDAAKHHVILYMFLFPAQECYLVARWCGLNGMGREFIYNAGRCIELAAKASLLFNSESTKIYGHNLIKMIDVLKNRFDDVFIDQIENNAFGTKPEFNTLTYFVLFLQKSGYPSIRYNPYGHIYSSNFIYMLDHTFFNLLFMCTDLDAAYSPLTPSLKRRTIASNPERNFDTLKQLTHISPLWNRLTRNNNSSVNVLLYQNSFIRSNYNNENETDIILTSETPVLEILQYIMEDSNNRAATMLRTWMNENIKMDKFTKKQFGIN
jgi:hypothetical protein